MIIFSFKSRSQALKFYNLLKSGQIDCKLINTPSAVHIGCGLSVQIGEADLARAREMFFSVSLDSFAGFYAISRENGAIVAQRLSF